MPSCRIREALPADRHKLAPMRHLLWPHDSLEEHLRELELGLQTVRFVAVFEEADGRESLIGFVEAGLGSHADGCDPARPVGYVEGWFVCEDYRNRGVGRDLIRAAEHWARTQGCVEMASDALIDNDVSQRAHEGLDFEVVDRCVHYRKRL